MVWSDMLLFFAFRGSQCLVSRKSTREPVLRSGTQPPRTESPRRGAWTRAVMIDACRRRRRRASSAMLSQLHNVSDAVENHVGSREAQPDSFAPLGAAGHRIRHDSAVTRLRREPETSHTLLSAYSSHAVLPVPRVTPSERVRKKKDVSDLGTKR